MENNENADEPTQPLSTNSKRLVSLFQQPTVATLTIIGFICTVLLIITCLLENNTVGQLVDVFASRLTDEDRQNFKTLTTNLTITYALQCVFAFLTSFLFQWVGIKIGANVQILLFERIMKQDTGFFDSGSTGELLTRLTTDCRFIESNVASLIPEIISTVGTTLLSTVYLFYISWRLTLALCLGLPFIGGAMYFQGKTERSLWQKQQEIATEANSKATECISQFKTIRIFGQENREIRNYTSLLTKVSNLGLYIAAVNSFSSTWVTLAFNLCIVVVFWTGGSQVMDGSLTGGQLISFVHARSEKVGQFPDLVAKSNKVFVSIERVFDIIERQPTMKYDTYQFPFKGEIEFRHVSFSYPTRPGVQVLKDLNLRVPFGQSVALVGSSGAGKSTIVSLLSRLYDTTKGSIFVDGVDIKEIDVNWLRRRIVFISQDTSLFATTIFNNITYGLDENDPKRCIEEVQKAAKLANAHNFISALPNGYDTVVGERGVTLSQGEKQRISIARAILLDPSVLIADELTSSLDNMSERLVQEALEKVMEGRTSIIIAHRLTTIRHCDIIYVISDGRVVEQGTYEELQAKGGEFSKFLHSAGS